jgi:hypothetical protein
MHPSNPVLAATLALATPLAAGPPGGITHARLESRSAAPGLAETVKAVLASRPGPFWTAWAVPTSSERSSCCWSSAHDSGRGCGGCRLEAEGEGSFQRQNSEPVSLEGGRAMRVLLRVDAGQVERIRAFSDDCDIDAGDLAFVWLEDVRPAESVALLAKLVGASAAGAEEGRRLEESGMAAIAFHADASADAALERFAASGQPSKRRRQAAFWLGHARGTHGYEVLSRMVREDGDPHFREHAVFALSQSHAPKAVDTIVEVARHDSSAHVRGQALFWLAQTAARRAPQAIRAALDDDPEIEVKKKAVFALSQLPKDEGVPLLIGIARTHKTDEVRKQAMFWLGQSGDPRALAFFEDVLKR